MPIDTSGQPVIGFTKVKLPYGWLGSMSPHGISMHGFQWRTAEALFQAMRFEDPEIRRAIREIRSPMGAKWRAKKLRKDHPHSLVVEPRSSVDLANMEQCLRAKVEQHPQLLCELLTSSTTKACHKYSIRDTVSVVITALSENIFPRQSFLPIHGVHLIFA